jgi:hypothetical protein
VFTLKGGQAADAAADHDAVAAWIDGREIDAGVLDRHFRGGDGELHVAVRTAGVLWHAEITIRLEVSHLARDLAVEGFGIQLGDAGNPAAPRFQAFPCGGQIVAQWRYTTNAGDDDASFVHSFGEESDRRFQPAQALIA